MELGKIHTRGPWQTAYKATNVLCSDGVRRTARITQEPDTFFSIPATVQVKGRTVSGFLTTEETDTAGTDVRFTAYQYRKNGYLLPGRHQPH